MHMYVFSDMQISSGKYCVYKFKTIFIKIFNFSRLKLLRRKRLILYF